MTKIRNGVDVTAEYRAWYSMKHRCLCKTYKHFQLYGGRGIQVCDRWIQSFDLFLLDMGKRPSNKHSIERIDNNGNYEPSNCKWGTLLEQHRNTRRTRYLTFGGETLPMIVWANRLNMSRNMLYARLKRMSVEEAITTPRMEPVAYRKPKQ